MKHRMLRKMPVVLLAMISMLLLTACKTELTGEEQALLEQKTEEAIAYYEEKYDEKVEVTDSSYFYVQGVSGKVYDVSGMYFKTDDNTVINYSVEDDRFCDNKQADEIKEDLLNGFWTGMLDETGMEYTLDDTEFYYNYGFNPESVGSQSFYNTYYDGDITTFMSKEEIVLETHLYRGICLVADEEDPDGYQEAANRIAEQIQENFAVKKFRFYVLEQFVDKDAAYEDRDAAVLAKYSLDEDQIEVIVHDFLDLGNGILVAADESDVTLKEGDITLEEADAVPYELAVDEEVSLNEDECEIYEVKFGEQFKTQLESRLAEDKVTTVMYKADREDADVKIYLFEQDEANQKCILLDTHEKAVYRTIDPKKTYYIVIAAN